MHQLGAQVLIAAILLPVIRDDGMTLGGACREWPKPKPADDRRGSERIGAGTMPSREAYEPERTVPALDRVAAADAVRPLQVTIFIPQRQATARGTVSEKSEHAPLRPASPVENSETLNDRRALSAHLSGAR
jgi:hypothetical protein